MKEVQDHYFRLAKEQGYRARSAFKLLEIVERFHVLRSGLRVLDVGAAPGSWLQVAASTVGARGKVIGIDLKEIDARGLPASVELIKGDLCDLGAEHFGGVPFDSIISDIGPDTSGVPSADAAISARLCNTILDRLPQWLRPGGDLVMKIYEGGDYPGVLRRSQSLFDSARGFKPKASRSESVEMYIICRGFRGVKKAAAEGTGEPPRRRPSPGWKKDAPS